MQYDKMDHVEIDKHFTKENLQSGLICTLYDFSKVY